MAFSLFNKKGDPPVKTPVAKPAGGSAAAKPGGKPGAVDPASRRPPPPTPAAPVRPGLPGRIDEIEAEMDSLDFTSPAVRSTPSSPAAQDWMPSAPAPFSADAASAAPMPSQAPVASAPATPPAAGGIDMPSWMPSIAMADPVAQSPAPPAAKAGKPLIEHGFNPVQAPARAPAPANPLPAGTAAGGSAQAKEGLARNGSPGPASAAAPLVPSVPRDPQVPSQTTPSREAAAKPTGPVKPPADKPVAAKARPMQQGVSSVMMMDIEHSPFESAPVLEEAAILFANGQDMAALSALQDALQQAKLPRAAGLQASMLLFDLFENLGMREEFEAAALDYAQAFETSPPAYVDRSGSKGASRESASGQAVAFSGALDASAAAPCGQLTKLAARGKTLQIDLTEIDSVDEAGCKLLMDHLRNFKKSGHELLVSGAAHLITLLHGAIETGRRSDPEAYWLLLLEMYQGQHMQTEHEEWALNYCITYEVSPPSWEEPAKPGTSVKAAAPVAIPATPEPQDARYLKGSLTGSADALIKDLGAYATGKSIVVIDLFDVRRVDFMSAGALLNLVGTLRSQGQQVELRSPSPLVAALLVSMGFLSQVRLTRRDK